MCRCAGVRRRRMNRYVRMGRARRRMARFGKGPRMGVRFVQRRRMGARLKGGGFNIKRVNIRNQQRPAGLGWVNPARTSGPNGGMAKARVLSRYIATRN